MATDVVSWVTSLLIGFLLSRDLIPKVSGWSEHTEKSSHRIQVVDNDPEFLVGAKGLDKPFCFHLESPENDVIRLLQDPISGIVVNARVFHDRHTNKSYLGTILMGGMDVRLLFRQNDLLINDRKFQWIGMNAMDVRGHRVVVGANVVAVTFRKKKITLVVRRHFVSKDSDEYFIDNETTSYDESEESSEAGTVADKFIDDNNSAESDKDEVRGDSARRKRRAFPRESPLEQNNFENNPSVKRSDSSHVSNAIINNNNNKLSSSKEAEKKSLIDIMSKRSPTSRHHSKRHNNNKNSGGGAHHRRHRKLRGKRYETSPFRPDDGDSRLRRVPSYNDVTQKGRDAASPVQSTEGKTVYLGLYILDSRDFSNKTHGLLGQFLFKNVTMDRIHYKNGRVKAKFIIDQDPARRTIALLSLRKNVARNTTRACWRVRHQGRDVIDGGYRDYVVPDMRDTTMMQLPPNTPILPRPVTPGPWPGVSTTSTTTTTTTTTATTTTTTTTLSSQDQEELSSVLSSSSTTTPAPPTYPTCVYETHHRVEPVGAKTNPNINPYFIATSKDKNNINIQSFGNNDFMRAIVPGNSKDGNNNNNNNNNHGPLAKNRNGWIAGINPSKVGAGGNNT